MVTWREWLVRKPKSIREALVVLPVAVAVIGLIWLGTTVSVHLSGPRQCSDDLWDDPDAEWIHAAYLVRREMFTRQYEDHWIVVMRAVPKALSSGDRAMLVVCHYETFNHVYSHFEILDPEQLDHIREVSSPTFLHPLTGY